MNKRRMILMLVCIMLLMTLLPLQVFATGTYNPNEPISLSVIYRNAGAPLTGAKFNLYLLAERTSATQLTVTDSFKNCPVDILEEDADYAVMAETLKGYIYLDNISPSFVGEIDDTGTFQLTTETDQLKHGKYLMIPQKYETDTHVYEAQAVIFDLPAPLESGEWVYGVTLKPKADGKPKDEETEYITRKVLKVWADQGHEKQRPTEIVVFLMKDGVKHDEVKLNAQNQWRYEWTNLDSSHEWTVVEQKVEGYTVTVERFGITLVITNTYNKPVVTPTPPVIVTPTPPVVTPTPPVVTPTPPVDVTPTPPVDVTPTPPVDVTPTPTPSEPVMPTLTPATPTPTNTPKPTSPPAPTLPQTGQLWWPVPILLLSGLVFIVIGIILRKRGAYDD